MRKIFLLAILAIVAVAFSSCDSPKFFIDHQVAYCGEQVEMTQNSQINVEYETIAFIWLYGQSGNCEIVTKYSKEEPPQKNFDDISRLEIDGNEIVLLICSQKNLSVIDKIADK